MTFQPRHISLAISLHVLLFGLLAGGVQCTRKVPPTRVIEAVLYDPSRQQVAQKKQTDEQRMRELERQKREKLEEDKRLEVEQQKKVAAEQKKSEVAARKKRQDDEAHVRREQDRQKKATEQQRVKKDQQEKKELVERQGRDAEMKTQMQREIEQENLRRQMDQEVQALQQREMKGKVDEWGAQVQRHIQKNWIRPGSSAEDFSCSVKVKLLPDGTVTSAIIERSCGNAVLNKSVEDAIFRASPIPLPRDPAAFTRDLSITFQPQ